MPGLRAIFLYAGPQGLQSKGLLVKVYMEPLPRHILLDTFPDPPLLAANVTSLVCSDLFLAWELLKSRGHVSF